MSSRENILSSRRTVNYILFTAALACTAALSATFTASVHGAELQHTIQQIKRSVVAVGTFLKTRSPSIQFVGTGFAVADGLLVITNAHVVSRPLDAGKKESRIVLVYKEGKPEPRSAALLAVDKGHDLALLKISGDPIPPVKLGDSSSVQEGRMLAFTGFPVGMVLGFHPATHRAMVAAITPIVTPGITARKLNAEMISRIRKTAYSVLQLDGTAYPGNSGSPLYDFEDGTVYGIINSVFVKATRESALSHPSGITFAIPSRYIRELLQREKIPASQ